MRTPLSPVQNRDTITRMRWLCLLAASAATLFAQLAPPNDAGVSLGHIHLTVPDPDAQIKVWTDVFGATVSKAGPLNLVKLPGIFIIVTKASATEGSNGSTANHIGFLVKDYAGVEAKLAAANIPAVFDNKKDQMIVTFPDQVRVEIMGDPSISTPVRFHHIHLMTTDPAALVRQDLWRRSQHAPQSAGGENPGRRSGFSDGQGSARPHQGPHAGSHRL
jgi:catechol 2,3-dioxygenase-like lactoylglutathione lyase family enzyme